MKGYKGFDKDFKCRGFQFEPGKTYTHDGKVSLCQKGFHACKNPLSVLTFYPLAVGNRFAEIELQDIQGEDPNDSKMVGKTITIGAEVGLPGLIKASVAFIKSSATNPTTGDHAHSATTGNYAHSATTGYSAHSATTGDSAHSEAMGKNSISAAIGFNGAAKGAEGNWIVLAEYSSTGEVLLVKATKVDGKKIKADTLYKLKDGQFVEFIN